MANRLMSVLASDAVRLERPREIFVIFSDFEASRPMRFYFLRRGFAHCFLLVRYSDDWVLVDPLFGSIFQARLCGLSREFMISLLRAEGCRVIVMRGDSLALTGDKKAYSRIGIQCRMVVVGLFSCVSFIKRMLNIRSPFIVTPYQLYCFLLRTKKENY